MLRQPSTMSETAALVLAELGPLAGTNMMIGHGVACYGAADRYLGMLAATVGDTDGACRHFEEASAPEPAHGGADVAGAHRLSVRQAPARNPATPAPATLLAEAAGLAEAIGMPALPGPCACAE